MNKFFKASITVVLFLFFNSLMAQEADKTRSSGYFSLFGNLSLSKQVIDDKGVGSQFNYAFDDVNSNMFKPGYSGGGRFDGTIKGNNFYSISLSANRVVSGSKYTNKYSLAPVIGDFTHYKADNKMTTINLAAHFRKLLPISDVSKYKFFLVLGPSVDYRISALGSDHVVYEKGKRIMVNGDLGLEFDNRGYYVLFAHYRMGASLSKPVVPISLTRFELGMSIKTRDLF
jgi:hypothetical protein